MQLRFSLGRVAQVIQLGILFSYVGENPTPTRSWHTVTFEALSTTATTTTSKYQVVQSSTPSASTRMRPGISIPGAPSGLYWYSRTVPKLVTSYPKIEAYHIYSHPDPLAAAASLGVRGTEG